MEKHESEKGRAIPAFAAQCIDYIYKNCLDIEGIFRLSGHAATMERVKAKINFGLSVIIDDAHIATGLLKSFLRSLPDPLYITSF